MEKLDVELYLEARKHYDYIWFEMQHATLTYADGKTSGSPSAPSSEASKKPLRPCSRGDDQGGLDQRRGDGRVQRDSARPDAFAGDGACLPAVL